MENKGYIIKRDSNNKTILDQIESNSTLVHVLNIILEEIDEEYRIITTVENLELLCKKYSINQRVFYTNLQLLVEKNIVLKVKRSQYLVNKTYIEKIC